MQYFLFFSTKKAKIIFLAICWLTPTRYIFAFAQMRYDTNSAGIYIDVIKNSTLSSGIFYYIGWTLFSLSPSVISSLYFSP